MDSHSLRASCGLSTQTFTMSPLLVRVAQQLTPGLKNGDTGVHGVGLARFVIFARRTVGMLVDLRISLQEILRQHYSVVRDDLFSDCPTDPSEVVRFSRP